MRNRISGADASLPGSPAAVLSAAVPVRVVIVTLDMHLAHAVDRVGRRLAQQVPGLVLTLHAAAEWEHNPAALERAKADIAQAHVVIATMLFLDDHVRAIRPALLARREACDAMAVVMSAPDAARLTRLGSLRMDAPESGLTRLLKRLRGKGTEGKPASGAGQMAMLRRLPRILRLIPGKAQDLRAFFLTMQYWLAGSDANIESLVRFLLNQYADGPRRALRGTLNPPAPIDYPDVGLYHPRLPNRMTERLDDLPPAPAGAAGTVGVLILRSYVLAGDTAHYDGVIAALEARGLRVLVAFATGLDSRPAIEAYFEEGGRPRIDALVSLTGFSLVGGPAYNDQTAAGQILGRLDVPYIAAMPVEFQTLEGWRESRHGLTPVEATMMVAIPELDGAIAPLVYGGRSAASDGPQRMQPEPERAAALAARVTRLVALRRTARAERRIAIVLFNFPPNAGATGTAAHLAVFESLFNTLSAMRRAGYAVDLPRDVDALRARLLDGNRERHGTDANVHALVPVDDHVRREPHLDALEQQWGPAPGRHLTNGRALYIQGAQFGQVFVGLQPGFGIEGDPMRLLFDGSFAPTHAFSAFYRWLREDFAAHAVLHFGTHGALEFMPGKQVGLGSTCWPERLIGDLPNVYLYAANNPSEGTLAKRRSAATLVSYLTPSMREAGLYKGLLDLKHAVERWRARTAPDPELEATIVDQAAALDLALDDRGIAGLAARLYEYEQALIPDGLHVVGAAPDAAARAAQLAHIAGAQGGAVPPAAVLDALAAGVPAERALRLWDTPATPDLRRLLDDLARANGHLAGSGELDGLLTALDGRFVAPAPSGDLLRTPEILPTGRNLHGFDPFRLPSAAAMRDGAAQVRRLLQRHAEAGSPAPETIAFVLWGSDNLKGEGEPIGQVLALLGARARFDAYGRLCGAELLPLEQLGRPRIDVLVTLSGIFRDLLPLQTRMLAEAAWLAASADEPPERNFVRKHALAAQAELGCDLEEAALRVFSNAEGAYGANVNHMIDAGCWTDGDELADTYQARKCFAYGRSGSATRQPILLGQALRTVDLAYQNIESLELGVTAIDHYVDTLGGISRAARRARGAEIAVYVGDQTQGTAKVRSLAEQVTLETRTRMLNPRWYDGLLRHGYEGVRQIEAQVTNTFAWSATTDQVAPWVYQRISETFVLDPDMRARLMDLNPKASARMANRLIEAHERNFWSPDAATLDALRLAGDEIEDRLEGVLVAAE
ncbi:magnesium chelatase subunit H [Zavarzinia sp. CC-PAN008]|uniref:magnesium chelatase subunit H n=1 Tax=Zavarzinia sp. CC-PAN008 TaxID=3243332 RepID=UPI003F744665